MKRIFGQFPTIIPAVIALWLLFVAERVYEVSLISLPGMNGVKGSYIAGGILFDLFLALIIAGVFSLVQLLVLIFSNRKITWLFHMLALIGLLANIALIEYYLLMKAPLDETIFSFSWQELRLIVGVGDRISIAAIAGLTGLIAGYFLLIYAFRKWTIMNRPSGSIAILFISIGTLSVSYFSLYRNEEKPLATDLVNNKLTFFTAETIDYFYHAGETGKKLVRPENFKGLDPDLLGLGSPENNYPLLHELENSTSFSDYFRKAVKPPNIVIVLVESLSTTLVGEYADQTGHLMPFLDSLSEKSLYFPNMLSTCERTYNVLPAVLASVPNAPNGKSLQGMRFPHHWSLINLLKKHYYSRFYCGVFLGYSNMNGYMNFLQTDYLVKGWDKKYAKRIDGGESPWGYADECIFEKSVADLGTLKMNRKSRMDVFLTISTHDPFIYPRTAYYTRLVRQRVAKMRQQTTILKEVTKTAAKYGAYSYFDDQLRKYFDKAKQSAEFENTIFIITGDHGTELCLFDPLSRFKIPLIIYSPLLKKSKVFHGVSTHLDIAPTILNFLRQNYLPDLPSSVPFIGKELDLRPGFHADRSIVFSAQYKNKNIFQGGYVQLAGALFKVDSRLVPSLVPDEQKLADLNKQLKLYNSLCRYTLEQDMVIPPYINEKYTEVETFRFMKGFELNPTKQAIREMYVNIGDFPQFPDSLKAIKIEFTCDYYCNSKNEFDHLPGMAVSLQDSWGPNDKLAYYQLVQPELNEPLKINSWNEIRYIQVVRRKDLEQLKKENSFRFYLFNDQRNDYTLRNFRTVISRDIRR